MDLSKIITITGKSGLFKVIAQSKNAIIVESLLDKKKFPVHASSRFNTLDEIYIYTTEEEIILKDVLLKIFDKENNGTCPVVLTDSNSIKTYFIDILPNYDTERVYESDMKKLFSWYNILHAEGLINKEEDKKEEGDNSDEQKPKAAKKIEQKTGAKKPIGKQKAEKINTNAPVKKTKNVQKKTGS